MYNWVVVITHLVCFAFSFYALTGLKFDKFASVHHPHKVQFLLLLASMALGYLVAQFILVLTVF